MKSCVGIKDYGRSGAAVLFKSELLKYSGLVAIPVVLLLIVLLLGAWWSPLVNDRAKHSSDSALEQVFRQHESEFNQLISMSNADAKVVRIAPGFTWLDSTVAWPRPEAELGFSKERWDEYRQLFKRLGIREGLARDKDGLTIEFIASSGGLLTNGSGKGYIYSTKDMNPLYDSLDNALPTDGKHIYKQLKRNWYLFYYSH